MCFYRTFVVLLRDDYHQIPTDFLRKPYGPGRELELRWDFVHPMPHQKPPFKHNEFEEQELVFIFLTKRKEAWNDRDGQTQNTSTKWEMVILCVGVYMSC